METLTFNNKSYAIDLNKLMEWISSPIEGNGNPLQSTVTEVWAKPETELYNEDGELIDELDLVTKEMTDIKSSNSDVSAKFDIIKSILDIVIDINYNPDGSLKSSDGFTFSEVMCLNTLIENGIIYEIDEDEK